MSDSVRPHRRQPTRPRHPWDSPGKNTGVSCHFLLQCMKVKSESEVAQSCLTLSDPMDCSPPGSSIHGIFQARVGCHCFLRKVTYLSIITNTFLWQTCFHIPLPLGFRGNSFLTSHRAERDVSHGAVSHRGLEHRSGNQNVTCYQTQGLSQW